MGDQTGAGGLLSWLGRSAANKVLTAALVVGVVAVLIWWFALPAESRDEAVHAAKMTLLWVLIAAALPWGLFFVPPMVVRMGSNAASSVMLAGYSVVDVLAAVGLMDWRVTGALGWGAILLGFLVSLVYNYAVCDALGDRADE